MEKNGKRKRAAIIPWWSGFSASYDTTNPKALDHLEARLRKLQKDFDIDGFKFDGGDTHHVKSPNVKFFSPEKTPSDYTKGWAELGYRFEYNEMRTTWKMAAKPSSRGFTTSVAVGRTCKSLFRTCSRRGLSATPILAPT